MDLQQYKMYICSFLKQYRTLLSEKGIDTILALLADSSTVEEIQQNKDINKIFDCCEYLATIPTNLTQLSVDIQQIFNELNCENSISEQTLLEKINDFLPSNHLSVQDTAMGEEIIQDMDTDEVVDLPDFDDSFNSEELSNLDEFDNLRDNNAADTIEDMVEDTNKIEGDEFEGYSSSLSLNEEEPIEDYASDLSTMPENTFNYTLSDQGALNNDVDKLEGLFEQEETSSINEVDEQFQEPIAINMQDGFYDENEEGEEEEELYSPDIDDDEYETALRHLDNIDPVNNANEPYIGPQNTKQIHTKIEAPKVFNDAGTQKALDTMFNVVNLVSNGIQKTKDTLNKKKH